MHSRPLLEDYLVRLVVLDLHILEEGLLIALEVGEQLLVLLERVLYVILEHGVPVDRRPDDLGQGLPAQHLADHLLLRPHRHLPHRVIVERVDAEGLALEYLSLLDVALNQGCAAALYDVEG